MYKKKSIFAIVFLLFLSINSFTTSYAGERQDERLDSKFKIVGYYSGDLFDEPLENLQTDKLTHVVYAFLIPKVDGTLVDLQKPQQLRDLVEQAHNDGAEVFIALGGWSYEGEQLEPVFREVAASDERRENNYCFKKSWRSYDF
ncbi:MAG: hypothetical protein GX947_10630 [Tissierellia bacterium]|nr:hypothetical protein [Tissierellia bacterium]